ncbi:sphingomyelin phosphodiesterase 4-like isoform X2 [Macrosteles quadrilineatus]|uniref:sphingomyelin phosphodiesterase 4-like isoform X2 n=1 Tax=Macrosteles quadrilineatus TaxID=74068 RepID=UPI0023E19A98|nr:sphingomyelin phosphodiesterase 4-like isoform X2 [Macrosteles quadrilineatus]
MQYTLPILQQPVHIRCDSIARWVDECTNKDLENLLPDIVEDIFGVKNRVGWGLMSIEYSLNSGEYDLLFKFLHPNGPMFRLCYKLLSDPYIKYKFPLAFLPQKVKQSIEEGTALPFYIDKLEMDPRTRTPLHLALNPFELYMFHFMYHIVNPCQKSVPYQETRVYSSLYLRLAEEYLATFLPCDGSTVLPELPNHYISQSPHRSIPQKPVRTSTLFRQEVLVKMLKQSPAANTLQSSPHVGIWRSELIVQLCLDFWLSMPNASSQAQMLWSEEQLPSSEHLHAVRLLVKHLHYFANSLVEDSSAMDELKKMIIPSSQRKVYHFIRQTMQHWPLDSSFKQILEIWLSYIQPWRYMDVRTMYHRPREDPTPVDSRWLPFIAENLLVYSVIFHQLIERFKMIDLASPKNAHMLFRLTKVFSQPNLAELLRQVEGSLGEFDGRGYSKWVQSHLLDLEGPAFQYKAIFSVHSKMENFVRQVKEAECQAVIRLEEESRRDEQTSWWGQLFCGDSADLYSLNERRNVPIFLSASVKNLINIFQIPEDSVDNINRSMLNNTPVSSRSVSINEMSPSDMKKRLSDLGKEGDPDLQPIRSYENAGLVRLLYFFCCWVNCNYCRQLNSLYMRRDLIGGIARQVLAGPQIIYYFDKSVPNVPSRVSTSLPPRLSLRVLANYHFLAYLSLLLLIASFASGFKLSLVMCFAFFSWIVFMVIRWLLGQAPLVPFVSVHDISDCRPNYSFG